MSNESPSFTMQKIKQDRDEPSYDPRPFETNGSHFYEPSPASMNLVQTQNKLCSPDVRSQYQPFYSVAPEVMGAVAVKSDLQPDCNNLNSSLNSSLNNSNNLSSSLNNSNFNSNMQGYFPNNPNFYPFTNDPFPPLGPMLNQPKTYSATYNPKPGLLFAPPFAFDNKFDSKFDLKFESKSNGQPLRGNQDRDYYLNLVLEPRSTDPPKHTYATLLAYAIIHAPEAKMTLDQIYTWVLEHFPYFETCEKDWRNSIRHNLSLNVMFERVPRQINELGKGSYWTCRPENAKKELDTMRISRKPRKPKPAFMPNLRGRFGFDNFNMPDYPNFGLRPMLDRPQRASHPPINGYANFQGETSSSFQPSIQNSFQPVQNSTSFPSTYSNHTSSNIIEQQSQSLTSQPYNNPFSPSYPNHSQSQFQVQEPVNPTYNQGGNTMSQNPPASNSSQTQVFQQDMNNYPPQSQPNEFYSYFPPTPISNNPHW